MRNKTVVVLTGILFYHAWVLVLFRNFAPETHERSRMIPNRRRELVIDSRLLQASRNAEIASRRSAEHQSPLFSPIVIVMFPHPQTGHFCFHAWFSYRSSCNKFHQPKKVFPINDSSGANIGRFLRRWITFLKMHVREWIQIPVPPSQGTPLNLSRLLQSNQCF